MSVATQWVSFSTIVVREIRRFMRIWVQTLVPPIITACLYFLIFGALIGSRIGPMEGVSYMAFVAPGLVMLSVITNSFMNTVSSFFSVKFQRSIEEILVSPTKPIVILAGFVIGGMMRGLLIGVMVLGVAAFVIDDFRIAHPWVALATALLSSMMFSLLGMINGIYANTFDDISIAPTFVLTPLIYLGGVFYSTSVLSPLWATASQFNPILYLVNAFRYGILGISDVPLHIAFAITLSCIALAGGFSLWMLHKSARLRH